MYNIQKNYFIYNNNKTYLKWIKVFNIYKFITNLTFKGQCEYLDHIGDNFSVTGRYFQIYLLNYLLK